VGFVGTDIYTATKSEVLLLANAYVDLGTWWYITPFIGAGVGTARVSIANFTDTGDFINAGLQTHSVNYADQASKWNLAWAVHAGIAYRVSQSLTLELAYSYVDMGSGITGASHSFDQVTNTTHAPFSFRNITSNDVTLGLRWDLDSFVPPPPPSPLIRKG
jgi:opacity protein-like surface antigen